MYRILLYYKYVPIAEPVAEMDWQRSVCQELGLKGRIIVAHEGLNGTVEGTIENIEEYARRLTAKAEFADIHLKRSAGTGSAFPKLSVKVRQEIVSSHLGEKDVNPLETTGKYLSAEDLHQWFLDKKEFYIVDMRNDYEHKVGHFTDSILPKLGHFRHLGGILPELESLKDKTVLTVCTGGVRCEKASGFLVKNGFSDVYQLQGGIVTYMEKFPNQDFNGQLYVFDGRITMGFNLDDPKRVVIGKCEKCHSPSESYINCANDNCHVHFICCNKCTNDGEPTYCNKCDNDIRVKIMKWLPWTKSFAKNWL